MRHPFTLDALLVYVAASDAVWTFNRQFQLGLYYLAQQATDAGYRVKVDNLVANDFVVQRLCRLLKRHACPLLGFYVDHDNQWVLRRVIPAIKERHPRVDIVIGGPQVTAAPVQTIERLAGALCGAIGEGEETFVELLAMGRRTPERLRACRGLVVANGGDPELTPPRPQIEPLDRLSIPKVRHLTLRPDRAISPMMMAGRGCTGRCAFCYEGGAPQLLGKRLRLHSAERCLEEIAHLVREFRGRYISIADDTFVADTARLREFCSGMIARYHGKVKWFCEARADTLARHPDVLPLMIEAGLLRIQIGGESGCQHILDAYRKGVTLDQIRRSVDLAKAHGLLSMYINFIVGGAWETADSAAKTRDFALELLHLAPGCVSIGRSFYTPYPGTPMFEHPEAFGITMVDAEAVTGTGDAHVFCRTQALSRMEILALGHQFQQAIQKAMNRLARRLSWATVARHFEAHDRSGVATEWYDVLSRSPGLQSYFSSLHLGRAKSIAGVRPAQLDSARPFRTIELGPSHGDQYVIRTLGGEVMELDQLDSKLIDLASGKLSLADICEIVRNNIPDQEPKAVRDSIIERFRILDGERLVLWKTDGQTTAAGFRHAARNNERSKDGREDVRPTGVGRRNREGAHRRRLEVAQTHQGTGNGTG